jgi:hypothetical protein
VPRQAAKTTLFAAGNEADVRKSAAGDFFQCTSAERSGMDMQVDPARSSPSTSLDEAIVIDDRRLDQMMRWHGTDETNLPPADTLKNLSRDTIAALRELRAARDTIVELRAAMGRAFWATDFRTLHAILLGALGPPPNERPQ